MSDNNNVDPTDLMLDSKAYDDLINEAAKDDRTGNHEAIVQKVVHDLWPSGDPRTKVTFVLITANNAKADDTLSPPPPPDVVEKEKGTWDRAKKQAISSAITKQRQLAKEYGVGIAGIKEGMRFKVKTVKTRRDDEGKGGFIRVVAYLPKDHVVGEQAAQAAAAPPPAF